MTENKPSWKKPFAIIYAGQAFSIISSSAVQFAIIWWLTVKTGSAMVLTTAALISFLPQAFIGPFAGVWVDRYSRKMIMILADGCVALASAALALAFLWGEPPVSFVWLILFVRALGGTFHSPAFQAVIPQLVPPEELIRAGGWGQLVNSAGYMAGPVIGAAMMGAFSLSPIMLLDILGAALAIFSLFFIHIPVPPPPAGKVHILRDMLEGLKTIHGNKPLLAISLPVLLCCMAYMPLGALFPLLVLKHFNGTAWHNSLVELLFSGGLLTSSLVIGIWGNSKRQFLLMNIAIMFLGLFSGISGLLPAAYFPLFAVMSFLLGAAGTLFSIPFTAYIQRTVPDKMMGKVMSLLLSAMSFSMPVGLLLAGPVSEAIGVANWFIFSGLAMVGIGITGYFLTRKYECAPSVNTR